MSIKKVKSSKFKSGYGWKIDFHRRGHRRIQRTFQDRQLAQAVYDQLSADAVRREFGLPIDSSVTLNDLINHHIPQMRARGCDKKNTRRAETVLNRFASIIGKNTLVEKIRRSDLRRYVELRLTADVKPQTINREMNEIKGALTKATTYFSTLEDWQPPKGAWLAEPSDGRRQTWSEEDVKAVLGELQGNAARRAVAEMFIIALQTGLRAGEVRQLKKSQLDFTNRLIIVTSKKGMSARRTARTREVPMSDEVFEILSRRFMGAAGQYLFPGKDSDDPLSAYLSVFKKACERAGIKYGLEDGMIFNDARRTAENLMLEAGHSARAVGDIFGHSAETMARNYARSTRKQRREAVESAGRNEAG